MSRNNFQGIGNNNSGTSAISSGVGFGSVLAVTISWSINQSLLWAILHGIFGWFYVIYYALDYAGVPK